MWYAMRQKLNEVSQRGPTPAYAGSGQALAEGRERDMRASSAVPVSYPPDIDTAYQRIGGLPRF